MNRETIKYCAFLKKDEVWQDMLRTARDLVFGTEERNAAEDPAKELLQYYSIPFWDEDLRNFSEEFLLGIEPEDIAEIICDEADAGFRLKEWHEAIDREIKAERRPTYLNVKSNRSQKLWFESLGGCLMFSDKSEPEAA